MPKPIIVTVSALFLLASATYAESSCSMSRDGDTHSFEHVYAVRVLADDAQLTILCLPEAASEEELVEAMDGLYAVDFDAGGLEVHIDPEMGPIYTVAAWGGRASIYSGSIWDIAFEGQEQEGRVEGRIKTTRELTMDEGEAGWRFVIEVDTEILEVNPGESQG